MSQFGNARYSRFNPWADEERDMHREMVPHVSIVDRGDTYEPPSQSYRGSLGLDLGVGQAQYEGHGSGGRNRRRSSGQSSDDTVVPNPTHNVGGREATLRTVYVGNLPSTATVDELLSMVRFGPIESIRLLPERNGLFISFLDAETAASFYSDAVLNQLALHGQLCRVGMAKATSVPAHVMAAVREQGATRCVIVGGVEAHVSEHTLLEYFAAFGPIDELVIVRDRKLGVVHFLCIAAAIKVVEVLRADPRCHGKRVDYGRDRCGFVPGTVIPTGPGLPQVSHGFR